MCWVQGRSRTKNVMIKSMIQLSNRCVYVQKMSELSNQLQFGIELVVLQKMSDFLGYKLCVNRINNQNSRAVFSVVASSLSSRSSCVYSRQYHFPFFAY